MRIEFLLNRLRTYESSVNSELKKIIFNAFSLALDKLIDVTSTVWMCCLFENSILSFSVNEKTGLHELSE